MEEVLKILKYFRVNNSELAESMGLSRAVLNTLLYEGNRALTQDQADKMARFLTDKYKADVTSDWLMETTSPVDAYELRPHGVWDGRPYVVAQGLYKYDPRPSLPELVVSNQLSLSSVSDEIGFYRNKIYRIDSWSIHEIAEVVEYINTKTGRSYSPLDVESSYIPLDKLVY